ncbi:MAG: phosphonate C-P lyase system protein PhnH [Bacteroidota bacterium]
MIRELNYNDVFDAQEHFRLIMNGMANPGQVQVLDGELSPVEGCCKASALVGFSLLDGNTCFYQNYSEDLDRYFILNTASRPTTPAQADFLFIKENDPIEETIEAAKEGELEYPEKGAFLVLEVQKIATEPFSKSLAITLKGPGVKGEEIIHVGGLRKKTLQAIKDKNMEYPLGVDTILTDPSGKMVGIPRSNQFTF